MPGWLTNGVTQPTPANYNGSSVPLTSVDTYDTNGANPQTAAFPPGLPVGPFTASVTATGTTQLGAKAITALQTNVVQVSTASTKGVRLPTAVTGLALALCNTGAFGVKVYPSTNGKIGSAATNAAYTALAVGKWAVFRAINKTLWVASY